MPYALLGREYPVKNLSSQLTHCELTWKLTTSSFRSHSSTSQGITRWTHTVGLLWALFEFATHIVSLLWAIREINWWAHHVVVAVSSLLTARWDIQVSPHKPSPGCSKKNFTLSLIWCRTSFGASSMKTDLLIISTSAPLLTTARSGWSSQNSLAKPCNIKNND